MVVQQAPIRVPSQETTCPSVVSITSVTNVKGDDKRILGAVHRSLGICLMAEESPGKAQLTVHEGCATSHHLKLGPLHPNEVSRFAQQSRKEKEGRKERMGILKGQVKVYGSEIFLRIQKKKHNIVYLFLKSQIISLFSLNNLLVTCFV